MFSEKTIFIDEEKRNEDIFTRRKMTFIMNALEDGWSVKKINHSYVFSKKHENKREVFLDSYLEKFIEYNMKEKGLQ
jgi:hypothetical protein